MKKSFLIGLILSLAFLTLSCQKVKEPDEVKEVQGRHIQNGGIKQLHSETKPLEMMPNQETHPQQLLPAETDVKVRKEESYLEQEPSPLTENEQKEFEKVGGALQTPNVFKSEKQAIRYLRILLKGNHKFIRWYGEAIRKMNYDENVAKEWYGGDIESALLALNPKKNKEVVDLAIEILKTKNDYPTAMRTAAITLKVAQDKSVVPLLREVAKHPDSAVRLEAAASLMMLDDPDTALPVLDELAEKEGYSGALYLLFTEPGKIIDKRGYNIVEKALNNPNAEVRISAVKLLWESKRIKKEKAERIALDILNELKDKKRENYGVGIIGGQLNPKEVVIPGYEGKDVKELEKPYYSDGRACDYAMSILGMLKSQKAVPFLKFIKENNTAPGHVCWENLSDKMAEKALDKILERGE